MFVGFQSLLFNFSPYFLNNFPEFSIKSAVSVGLLEILYASISLPEQRAIAIGFNIPSPSSFCVAIGMVCENYQIQIIMVLLHKVSFDQEQVI